MKYIWTMPWSAVKCISFFIRYSFLPFMIISLYGEYLSATFKINQMLIFHRKQRDRNTYG